MNENQRIGFLDFRETKNECFCFINGSGNTDYIFAPAPSQSARLQEATQINDINRNEGSKQSAIVISADATHNPVEPRAELYIRTHTRSVRISKRTPKWCARWLVCVCMCTFAEAMRKTYICERIHMRKIEPYNDKSVNERIDNHFENTGTNRLCLHETYVWERRWHWI